MFRKIFKHQFPKRQNLNYLKTEDFGCKLGFIMQMYHPAECVEIDEHQYRIVPSSHHTKPISGTLIYAIQSIYPSLCREKDEKCADLNSYGKTYDELGHKTFLTERFYETFMTSCVDADMLRDHKRYSVVVIDGYKTYTFIN